jgi:metallophosphoesterase (TIGR00282 family)
MKAVLPELMKEHEFDLIIANAENIAHGKGVTTSTINEMKALGVDYFTTGNHVWGNAEGVEAFENDANFPVLRPANFPPGAPGKGAVVIKSKSGEKVLLINLQGRVFMDADVDCPFRAFDSIYEEFKKEKPAAIIVDFHAEATSEKVALKWYLNGRATVLYGTHTHIPTADAQVTDQGLAYITDMGMTGPSESVLGVSVEVIIEKFLTQRPRRHEIPVDGPMEFHAMIIDVTKGKATHVEFIRKLLPNV